MAVADLTEKTLPADQADVVAIVRAAHDESVPLYAVGGGTALDFGGAARMPGRRLDLSRLSSVVDYTPRDMTIVVDAGMRVADLLSILAAEGQHLPIDIPRAKEATIGGVVATNWNGPRRYGYGTVRDYVIGIHAVDGRGVAFKGGGRVVKNVAGYDFCKLLTGSMGTLGVITRLALKVKPLPECTSAIMGHCQDLDVAAKILARLVHLEAPPVAVDLLNNVDAEIVRLVIRAEGTENETRWLVNRIVAEMRGAGGLDVCQLDTDEYADLWTQQVEFADQSSAVQPSPLVLQIIVPPSAVTKVIADLTSIDKYVAIQAHAASGIVVARFSKFSHAEVSSVLNGVLRPNVSRLGGSVVVLSSTLEGLTPHVIWGGRTDAMVLLEKVKAKFDPKGILNPGRYVFQNPRDERSYRD